MSTRLLANQQKLITECTVPDVLFAKLQKIIKSFPIEDLPGMQTNDQPGLRKQNFENAFLDLTRKFINDRVNKRLGNKDLEQGTT